MADRVEPASDSLLRRLGNLRREANRRQAKLLRVEGRRTLLAALESGWRPKSVVAAEPGGLPEGLPLFIASAEQISRRMAMPRLDPVVALGPLPDRHAIAAANAKTLVVIGVQDPGNLGAILRTAVGLGVEGALLLPGCPDPFNPRVVHASAGAVIGFPVAIGDEAAPDGAGRCVLLAQAHGGEPPTLPPPERWALILGHETRGLPPAWEGKGVSITLQVKVESLGVAASAAILLDRLLANPGPSV